MDVGPGDLVECVSVVNDYGFVVGCIYTVRLVYRDGEYIPEAGFISCYDTFSIVGFSDNLSGNRNHWGWAAIAFRPVRRPDPKFLTELLNQKIPLLEPAQ